MTRRNPLQDWYKQWTKLKTLTRENILFEVASLRQDGYSFKRAEIELARTFDIDDSFASWVIKYYKHVIEGL